MNAKLTEDIISNFKSKLYGKRGETVAIIKLEETVAIVENNKGIRFPVSVHKISIITNGQNQNS